MITSSLYSANGLSSYTLTAIPTHPLLSSLGLRQGSQVSIVSRQPLGGPIVIRLGQRCLAIARDIAEQIQIQETAR
ncbi:FeoA family protein [Desulfurispira natronophila]|uniref:Ferrous iron transport protein A n=1 Tax=Desulfurispira natronophila TaxID=682562 RepID=A0A7W7Y6A0_9BACT|nr:FeoA family protein [Desulfurispira natronophila]MBB5022512.1 ferrous iron transport protein A [Desulfurispira natronophila]